VLEFLCKVEQPQRQAWLAMRLAAASISIPELVFKNLYLILTSDARTRFEETEMYSPTFEFSDKETFRQRVKHISDFFQCEEHGGRAIRNFLIRCLVSKFDETGLAAVGICSTTLGDWIEPFISPIVQGRMEGLLAVPHFQENLKDDIDEDWPNALDTALRREDSMQTAYESAEFARQLKKALDDPDDEHELAFCRLPCAIWCVLLRTLEDKACLIATQDYRDESNLDKYFFPGAPDGPMEMMRRLGPVAGFRTLNRCPCGEIYAIGECGRPMEVSQCTSCRRQIGGTAHNFVNGHNQGVAVIQQQGNLNVPGIHDQGQTDDVQGIHILWFQDGFGYRERDLEPLEYRILCLLLLMPLAAFSPRKEDGQKVRRAQLRKHWDAFKLVSGRFSDTEAQHFLIGILVRASGRPRLLEQLAMSGCDFTRKEARADTEESFTSALKMIMNGDSIDNIVADVQASINDIEKTRQVSPCA
jgi:hypothetical protein